MSAAWCSSALCKPALPLHGQSEGDLESRGDSEKLPSAEPGVIALKPSQMLYPLTAFLGIFGRQVFDCACSCPSLFLKAQFRGNKPMIFPGKIKTVVPFN